MKYSPQIYAKAFSEVRAKPPLRKADLVKNFLTLAVKNNDQHLLKKIYQQAERLVRERSGRRKIIFETARKVKNLNKIVKKIIKKDDIVEYNINPEIIAGVKITINGETQFDGSMQRKIKELFQ